MTSKKQPWAMTDGEAFKAKMQRFCEEGGGLMRLYLVRYNDLGLYAAVKLGDPLALTLAAAAGRATELMKGGDHLCLVCNRLFEAKQTPHAFIVWLPGGKTEEPAAHENVVTQPICGLCCRRRDDREIMAQSLAMLKLLQLDVDIVEETEDYLE